MRRAPRRAAVVLGVLVVLAASPLPAPAALDDTVEPLLALLETEQVPATFFLTGRWTLAHPRAARAIAADGHLLANHGFSHFHMEMLPAPMQLAEAWWAEQAVRLVCGQTPVRLFRPPHGGTDDRTESFLASHDFRTIMWTKNPSDWRLDGSVTAEGIRSAIEPLEDGDILVCHLRNAETIDALASIIPELKSEGSTFGVLDADELTEAAASAP